MIKLSKGEFHTVHNILCSFLLHIYTLYSGKLKQEMVRNEPLDMQPYGMILGTHRQPNEAIDKLLHTDETKHIIIINNNHVSTAILAR